MFGLTIGQMVLTGVIGLTVIVCSYVMRNYLLMWEDIDAKIFMTAVVTTAIITVIGMVCLCRWYNTSTASGIREYKDFKSEMSNGLEREITITAEDGREIFHYEGKFDIERHEDGDDRYLRFETQDNQRFTISYGVQDTVIIVEKANKQ